MIDPAQLHPIARKEWVDGTARQLTAGVSGPACVALIVRCCRAVPAWTRAERLAINVSAPAGRGRGDRLDAHTPARLQSARRPKLRTSGRLPRSLRPLPVFALFDGLSRGLVHLPICDRPPVRLGAPSLVRSGSSLAGSCSRSFTDTKPT
jgi:hypothetical protein